MHRSVLVMLTLAACDRAFGVEHRGPPRDGAADVDMLVPLDANEWRCPRSVAEDMLDEDGDGMTNDRDPCPTHASGTADADGDGIGDLCDPFPAVDGVRVCATTLLDPTLNKASWMDPGMTGWNHTMADTLAAPASGNRTLLAAADLSPDSGTVTVDVLVQLPSVQQVGKFNLYLRAGATTNGVAPMGCKLYRADGKIFFEPTGEDGEGFEMVLYSSAPSMMRAHLRATFTVGTAANVTCEAQRIDDYPLAAYRLLQAPVKVPPGGTIGFNTDTWAANVEAIDMTRHP